jgi:hypothetical protein
LRNGQIHLTGGGKQRGGQDNEQTTHTISIVAQVQAARIWVNAAESSG